MALNPRKLSLAQLELFQLVFASGNLSRTAAALDTSQPAVSRKLNALEETLGVKLFHRTGRGVTPTQAGNRLAEHAKTIFHAVDDAESDLMLESSSLAGQVRLGVTPMVAQTMTGPLIAGMAEKFPRVTVTVMEGASVAVTDWVTNGAVDVAIMYKPPSQFREGVDGEVLLEEPLCVVGRDDLMSAGPISFEDAMAQKMVLPSPLNGMRRTLDKIAAEKHLPLQPETEIDSYATILSLVRTGMAVTTLPALAVDEEVRLGLVKARPICDPEVTAYLSSYVTRAHPIRRSVRVFIDLTNERAGALRQRIR